MLVSHKIFNFTQKCICSILFMAQIGPIVFFLILPISKQNATNFTENEYVVSNFRVKLALQYFSLQSATL